MPETSKKPKRWFLLGSILAGTHIAFFFLVFFAVSRSSDPETGMAYWIFYPLDYPVSRIYSITDSPIALICILGGPLWFLYGFVLQSLFTIRRPGGVFRLTIGCLLLALAFLLPEICLKSMPRWEEDWERGTAAANGGDLEKAIGYVSEAVQLSPEDNSILCGMWDYLGRLFMDKNDYKNAENAFTNEVKTANPASTMDLLNAYNALAGCYQRAGEKQKEKAALQKAIDYNRISYGGDSTQEASCWQNLAEIAHDDGDLIEARALMEKAITMESSLPSADTFSVGYMKDELAKWSDK